MTKTRHFRHDSFRHVLGFGVLAFALPGLASAWQATTQPTTQPVIRPLPASVQYQQTMQQQQTRDQLQKSQLQQQLQQGVADTAKRPSANDPRSQRRLDQADRAQRERDRASQQDLLDRERDAANLPRVVPQAPPASSSRDGH